MSTRLLTTIQGGHPFPLLGKRYTSDDYAPVDLSIDQPQCAEYAVHTFTGLDRYITYCHKRSGARILYGGYLENRAIYQRSTHFTNPETARTIHLGLDLWEEAGVDVFAPLDGRIHSCQYNDQPLDYGGTIILEHTIDGQTFFTLYGHLSKGSLERWHEGKTVTRGEKIAQLGAPAENGGWVPHLHFQVIKDMEGMHGDYPGVCAPNDVPKYRNNCPDPTVFLL